MSPGQRAAPVGGRGGSSVQVGAGTQASVDHGADTLAVARRLCEAGASVFVAAPNPRFDPSVTDRDDPRTREFLLPTEWQDLQPDPAALDRWEPGWAVCLVGGGLLDAVDVDAKHGADTDEQARRLHALDVTILGRSRTPSGGAHLFVAATGICSTARPVRGVDFRGRGLDGTGAGFVYLPGTRRPRYGGAGYAWESEPDLDELALVDRDEQRDGVTAYLAGLGVTVRTRREQAPVAEVGGEPVDVQFLPGWLQELLHDFGPSWATSAGPSKDRSARFHHLAGACRRAGLTQGQTVTAVDPWCHAVGKYAGRVAAEVARSWPKVDPPRTEVAATVTSTGNASATVVTAAAGDPARWFAKDGLLAADLAEDIHAVAPLRRDLGDQLWGYAGGVWRPDRAGWVRAATTSRLGNRSRPAHTNTVLHYLLGRVPVLECRPVPEYLNVSNGLLDWRTGTLHPHDPDVLSTVQLGTGWAPGATCPTVDAWLAEVLPADLLEPGDGGPGFVWEVIGYLCFSGNPLHKAILLLGSGRNGKGTFLRLVTALLGRGNVSSVDLHSLVTNRFRAAELFGKVANIAGDLDGAWLESTAVFKAITGGDSIPAERKYGQPFDFTPFAVPVYSANKVFGTPDTTDGYLSRWVVIPFPNVFLGVEDRGLDDRLQQPAELAGLLVKAVDGLRAVLARGNFTTPASVAAAQQRFADESDPVRAFVREVSRPDPDGFVTREALWDVYRVWCDDDGRAKPLSRSGLYARLETAGWHPRKREGVRGFAGRTLVVRPVDVSHGAGFLRTLHPVEHGSGADGADGAAFPPFPPRTGPGVGEPAPSAPAAPPTCPRCGRRPADVGGTTCTECFAADVAGAR